MKRLNAFNLMALLALFSVLLFTTSCEKDDNATVTIEGNWIYNDLAIEYLIDNKTIVEYLVGEGVSQAVAEAFETQLLAEVESEIQADMEMPTSVAINTGGTFVATFSDASTSTGEWDLSGDGKVLTLTEGADVNEFMVESLTGSQLILSFTISFMEDMDEDGTPETPVVVTVEMQYKR